jgi:AraC-like DNA-binding protein
MSQSIENYSQFQKLMDHASQVLGLRICYHDRQHNSRLPLRYRRHWHPACLKARSGKKPILCVEFDVVEVHDALKNQPDGRIHVCPYGLTEIVAPVFVDREFAGVLFAGPCWSGEAPSPYPELVHVEKEWLEKRLTLLQAVSAKFSSLIQIKDTLIHPNQTRRNQIIDYLRKKQHSHVGVSQLASHLFLSPSRTSHIVNNLFEMSLPNLINAMKLKQSTYWLSATELSIGEIAERSGYKDQNYYTRLFSKKYRLTPTEYRRRYPFDV